MKDVQAGMDMPSTNEKTLEAEKKRLKALRDAKEEGRKSALAKAFGIKGKADLKWRHSLIQNLLSSGDNWFEIIKAGGLLGKRKTYYGFLMPITYWSA